MEKNVLEEIRPEHSFPLMYLCFLSDDGRMELSKRVVEK